MNRRICEQSPSVARAFGVRGLDPALTFGGVIVELRKIVTAHGGLAGHTTRSAEVFPSESKSGVKPPHCAFSLQYFRGTIFGSKASRHSRATVAKTDAATCFVAAATTIAVGEARAHGSAPMRMSRVAAQQTSRCQRNLRPLPLRGEVTK